MASTNTQHRVQEHTPRAKMEATGTSCIGIKKPDEAESARMHFLSAKQPREREKGKFLRPWACIPDLG